MKKFLAIAMMAMSFTAMAQSATPLEDESFSFGVMPKDSTVVETINNCVNMALNGFIMKGKNHFIRDAFFMRGKNGNYDVVVATAYVASKNSITASIKISCNSLDNFKDFKIFMH